MKRKFITFSVLTGLLVMVIAYLFSRNIAARLAEAVEIARTVAAGDFSRNVPINHKDEIGMLTRALNSMTVSLREMFQEIHSGVQALTVSSSELSAGPCRWHPVPNRPRAMCRWWQRQRNR